MNTEFQLPLICTFMLFAVSITALLLNIAILRAPDIMDSHLGDIGRRLEICAWFCAILWYGHLAMQSMPMVVRWPTYIIVMVLGISRCCVALGRLFPEHPEREHA